MHNDDQTGDSAHADNAHEQAERCRRLSRSVYDRATAEMLSKMAQNFDRTATAANED